MNYVRAVNSPFGLMLATVASESAALRYFRSWYMQNTGIGWAHHTFNSWLGCAKISTECLYCYIRPIMLRGGREPFDGPMRTLHWDAPFKWQRQAERQDRRFRVFTCSMSDFFHPGADAWRGEAWQLIRECDRLDFMILTKRAELIADRLPADWGQGYANVWLGVTCGVRSSLERLDILAKIPAAVRFVSAEPLLEPIDFSDYLGTGLYHWIITGCERAAQGKRREMSLDWVRDIDHQCREAGVAHFFKQRYVGTQICENGMLDGVVRQEFPRVSNRVVPENVTCPHH